MLRSAYVSDTSSVSNIRIICVLSLILMMTGLTIPGTPGDHTIVFEASGLIDKGSREVYFEKTIVINEIHPDPVSDLNGDGNADQLDEFIELFNSGVQTLYLDGWTLRDPRDDFILDGVVIGPGSRIILFRSETSIILGRDDQVFLENATGSEVDSVSFTSVGSGISIQRSPDGSDRLRNVKIPTPGEPNIGPPNMMINEVMIDPEGSNTGFQWIELINLGDDEYLEGFRLDNGESVDTALPPVLMRSGERILISLGSDEGIPLHPDEIATIGLSLDRSLYVNGDNLEIADPDGYCLDYVAWGSSSHVDRPEGTGPGGNWSGQFWDDASSAMTADGEPNIVPEEGKTIARIPDSTDSDSPSDWMITDSVMGNSAGWNNTMDPSLLVEFEAGEIILNLSETIEVPYRIENIGNLEGNVSISILMEKTGWSMVSNTNRTVHLDPEGMFTGRITATAPPDLTFDNQVDIVLTAVPETMDFIRFVGMSTLTVPGFDLSVSDLSITSQGVQGTVFPQGSTGEISGIIRGGGQLTCEYADLTMTVEDIDGGGSIIHRDITPYTNLRPSSRREFSRPLDMMHMKGNYSIGFEINARDGDLEINTSNDRAGIDITVVPSTVPTGMRGLLISETLWNATEDERYVILENPAHDDVDLSWTRISDGSDHASFPDGAVLGSGNRLAVIWSDTAMKSIPGVDRIFRMDDSGPSDLRMYLEGDTPDPGVSGEISFLSRYRHEIDSIRLTRDSMDGDYLPLGGSFVETTHGTVMFRKRDSRNLPIDTNTSLDWDVGRIDTMISAFLPRPGSESTGEIVIIRSGRPGSDISGCALISGRYLAVIPNGTYTDENGEVVISRDPQSFRSINGFDPDLCTDWDTYIDGDDPIPGCRVSGYGELILPDNGGSIVLLDPGSRIMDSVTWGAESDINTIPRNALIGRSFEGSENDSGWKLIGTGSSPDTAPFNSDLNTANCTYFQDLISALDWIGPVGDLTIWTAFIQDRAFSDSIVELMEAGNGVDVTYLIPPWSELPDHIGGGELTAERIRIASDLLDHGAGIYHVEREFGYGPVTIFRGGNRLIFSLYSPGSIIGNTLFPLTIGYELGSPEAVEEMIGLLVPSGVCNPADSCEFLDLLDAPANSVIEEEAGNGSDHGSGEFEILDNVMISFSDPLDPVEEILPGDDSLILHLAGELDYTSIMDRLGDGGGIRIMISPGSIRPYPGGSGSFYEAVEGRIGDGDHLIRMEQLREDLLVRSAAAMKIADERGFDLQIRVAPPDHLDNIGGNLMISGGSVSFGYCWEDTDYPSRMIRVSADPDMIDTSSMEKLWSDSLELPIHMSGYISEMDPKLQSPIRIREIYYDTYLPEDPDEYVALYNQGPATVDLSGHTISDDEGLGISSDGTVILGPGSEIDPGETMFIAMNGDAFRSQNGFDPDASWNEVDTGRSAHLISGFMRLGNNNDTVCLRDELGRVVDVVPYGSAFWKNECWQSRESGEWMGDAAPDIGWGRILKRNDGTGEPALSDTNSAEDWLSIRPYHPGQSRFSEFEPGDVDSARIGICPVSSSPILRDVIESAGSDLLINVYELTSEWITSALIGARTRGVEVRLILEGSPVGGMSYTEKYCLNRLNGSGVHIRIMTSDIQNGIRDSYRYDHAKYIIRDGEEVLVSSDNFKDSSFPRIEVRSHSGTRGWITSMMSRDLAGDMSSVFESDWNGPDMIPWIEDDRIDPDNLFTSVPRTAAPGYLTPLDDFTAGVVESARIIISPDHLGSTDNSLIDSIRNAESEILLELMDIKEHFDTPVAKIMSDLFRQEDGIRYPGRITSNPYLDEIFRAAGRGVSVKLLLDGSDFNGDSIPDNGYVCDWINEMAVRSGVAGTLTARLHPGPRYLLGHEVSMIHNKGMIIDGREVWISSFNWGPTSAVENREVGVLLASVEAAEYLNGIFMLDWGATLESEIDLRTGHLINVPTGSGHSEFSMGISVNLSMLGMTELLVSDADGLDLSRLSGGIESAGRVSLDGGRSYELSIEWTGDPDSDYILLVRSDERILPVSLIHGVPESSIHEADWSYPWYREPVVPIIMILIISLGVSALITAFSWVKKGEKIAWPDERHEE